MDGESIMQPGQQIKPEITIEKAKDMASALYGFSITEISELNAYDDKNYHILIDGNNNPNVNTVWQYGYVLKIMNSLDSQNISLVEGQHDILTFLRKHNLNCPNPVQNINGFYYSIEDLRKSTKDTSYVHSKHVVRLFEYQPGTLLFHLKCTNDLFFDVGRYLAKLNQILKEFSHPAYTFHKSVWSLESVPSLDKFLSSVENKNHVKLVKEVMEAFKNQVIPSIDVLEKGMIHGDFNEQNILCSKDTEGKWRITAILDFGDSHYSCYIFELAIAICYMMLQCKDNDPLEASGYVLAGYATIRELPDIEYKLLKLCISARYAQSLVLGAYSYSQNPGNEYVLISAKRGWNQLESLWSTPKENVYSTWDKILSKSMTD